jgi:hypothetical protein
MPRSSRRPRRSTVCDGDDEQQIVGALLANSPRICRVSRSARAHAPVDTAPMGGRQASPLARRVLNISSAVGEDERLLKASIGKLGIGVFAGSTLNRSLRWCRAAMTGSYRKLCWMIRRAVSSEQAPAALGPYSQAIVANGLVFCSGMAGIDPAGVIPEGIEAQTEQALTNLAGVLQAAGASMDEPQLL